MVKVKVKNMTGNSGREVCNQFEIRTDKGTYFQSYDSIIAKTCKPVVANGKYIKPSMLLDRNKWDYSTTTGRYRNIFLGEKKPETERKIKDGIYVLTNLN